MRSRVSTRPWHTRNLKALTEVGLVSVGDLARKIGRKLKPKRKVTDSYEARRARGDVGEDSAIKALGPTGGMLGNTDRV